MDSYQVLKSIHKVGHPISGTVIGYDDFVSVSGERFCGIVVETDSEFKSILPFDYLFDNPTEFDERLLPEKGVTIDMVVKNHVDDVLYLSARPSDTSQSEIEEYKHFYSFIESIETGDLKIGKVEKVMPFGIFVDLSIPYLALIDIGHSEFNGGERLPLDNELWPKEGDSIKCMISYFRFYNKQIGLGWIPFEN